MGLMPWTPEGMQDDYDWREAWSFGRPAHPCEGAECSGAPCDVDDIARVLAASDGENDGPAWVAVAVLKDGRYAYVEAGCDYTGWECQAGGTVWVSHSLDNLVAFGLTQQGRERLGDELAGYLNEVV